MTVINRDGKQHELTREVALQLAKDYLSAAHDNMSAAAGWQPASQSAHHMMGAKTQAAMAQAFMQLYDRLPPSTRSLGGI